MKGTIIAFRVYKHNDHNNTNRFGQNLWGQDTSSHKGKYHHHKHGLMEDIPHIKLIRGVIIVTKKDTQTIINFLKKYNAEIHAREITLTPTDKKTLKTRD